MIPVDRLLKLVYGPVFGRGLDSDRLYGGGHEDGNLSPSIVDGQHIVEEVPTPTDGLVRRPLADELSKVFSWDQLARDLSSAASPQGHSNSPLPS